MEEEEELEVEEGVACSVLSPLVSEVLGAALESEGSAALPEEVPFAFSSDPSLPS